jgi:hypothetical protein
MHDHDTGILTPKERPNHHVIGRYFRAWDGQVYFCDSYDPRIVYYMTNVLDARLRKDVSTRAPGRTFHEIGTQDRPTSADKVRDVVNFTVDTTVPPEAMVIVPMHDRDCLDLPERTALFQHEFEAKRFITIVLKAAEELRKVRADKAAAAAATTAP